MYSFNMNSFDMNTGRARIDFDEFMHANETTHTGNM